MLKVANAGNRVDTGKVQQENAQIVGGDNLANRRQMM